MKVYVAQNKVDISRVISADKNVQRRPVPFPVNNE